MLFVATVSVLVAAAGSIVFQQGKFGEPGTWCDPHDMDGMLLTIVPPFFVVVPIGRHRRDCTSHRTSVAIFFSFLLLLSFPLCARTTNRSGELFTFGKKILYIPLYFFLSMLIVIANIITLSTPLV